jgi:hypothetical protein
MSPRTSAGGRHWSDPAAVDAAASACPGDSHPVAQAEKHRFPRAELTLQSAGRSACRSVVSGPSYPTPYDFGHVLSVPAGAARVAFALGHGCVRRRVDALDRVGRRARVEHRQGLPDVGHRAGRVRQGRVTGDEAVETRLQGAAGEGRDVVRRAGVVVRGRAAGEVHGRGVRAAAEAQADARGSGGSGGAAVHFERRRLRRLRRPGRGGPGGVLRDA